MPSDTFFNLPAPKRARFVDAALDEFGRQPFDRASLSALARRLEIAKGSIYQYFDNKVDLYTWLISQAGERKMALVAHTATADAHLFDRLTAAYAAGLRLLCAEPRWAAVVLQLEQPSVDPHIAALREQGRQAALAWLRSRLIEGQQEGVVRVDLDLDLTTHLVHATLSDGLRGALQERAGLRLEALADDPDAWVARGPDVFPGVVAESLEFLRRALAPGP